MTTVYSNWYYTRIEQKIDNLLQRVEKLLMASAATQTDVNAILAKVTADNNILTSIQTAVTALSAGQSTIAAEIDILKNQNPGVDLTDLSAAVDSQAALVSGLATAIPANTG